MSYADQNWLFDTDINAWLEGIKGNGVVTGLGVTAQSPAAMNVDVAAGTAVVNGTRVTITATTGTLVSDGSNPRKGIITLNSSGTVTVTMGTAAASVPTGRTGPNTKLPAPADLPSNQIVLAEVWVPAAATTIVTANITDRRVWVVPRVAGGYVVAASDTDQPERADFQCDGTADDVQIEAAMALGPTLCLKGTYVTSSPIDLDTDGMSLVFETGSVLDYTGSDAAFILSATGTKLEFYHLISTDHAANYAIKDKGAKYSRVRGYMIGPLESASAHYFVEAGIFYDAANASATSGTNCYEVSLINRGKYGVKLDSASGKTYEGSRFLIGCIMRQSVECLQIGSDISYQTVQNNSFYVDLDSQSVTPLLLHVYNRQNFILVEHIAAATGDIDFTLEYGAGASYIVTSKPRPRISDLGGSLHVVKPGQVNLLVNGSFEAGSPPARWDSSGGTWTRSNTQYKLGSYAGSLTVGAPTQEAYQTVAEYEQLQSRTVSMGVWAWADTADKVRGYIHDGVSNIGNTPYHSGGSRWEWLTATGAAAAGASNTFKVSLQAQGGSITAYFDGAILVEGSYPTAYSTAPSEFLVCHHTGNYTLSAFETGHVLHTNLGAGGNITLTLPQTVSAGFVAHFAVMAVHQLHIDPGAAGAIYINGAKQTDDKYIWADDEAESVTLVADGNGDWVAVQTVGTWGVEA